MLFYKYKYYTGHWQGVSGTNAISLRCQRQRKRNKMAEEGSSPHTTSIPDSDRTSTEKEASMERKRKYEFEECADLGKLIIESMKASLVASSRNFHRSKYVNHIENPYTKAYQYVEKHQVVAMLEVFDLKFLLLGFSTVYYLLNRLFFKEKQHGKKKKERIFTVPVHFTML